MQKDHSPMRAQNRGPDATGAPIEWGGYVKPISPSIAPASLQSVRKRWYAQLYFQVLVAVLLGASLGVFFPTQAASLKPLADAMIKVIRMTIAPIVFCTVVHGIASMKDMKMAGRVGVKALIYFEIGTTAALVVGLVVVNLWRPGAGMNVDAQSLDPHLIQAYVDRSHEQSAVGFLMNIIPDTVVGAFAAGDMLQVLFFSVLFAFALQRLGSRGQKVLGLIGDVSQVFFNVMAIVMRFAPIAAFGAMAFTIGKYGLGTVAALTQFMLAFYATCLLFIFGVLGLVCRLAGFSIFKLVRYLKEELLLVFGFSSSEPVLPRFMLKMEHLGCHESVVGLVIPTGYSFNLDGTCIYLTMTAIFLAQATNTNLTLEQQLGLLAVLLVMSKGAAAVTGSGFIVLAATLGTASPVPVASLALVLGIDRFMSEARALTNFIGTAVATIFIAKWENALDQPRMNLLLAAKTGELEQI
jgi:aerobic C4-dicarboxylate transport protein